MLTEEALPTPLTPDTADTFEAFEAVEKLERAEAALPPPAVEEADEPVLLLLPVLLQLVDSFRTDLPGPSLPAMLGAIRI